MPLYDATVTQLDKMLANLDSWIEEALAHAEARGFDPSCYATYRLAPDQYTFTRQVQAACDAAKFVAARSAGKDAPKHEDGDATVEELRARIALVREFLATFTPADFEGADDRVVALPFLPGKGMKAEAYVLQMALPNFYFHLVHAYAILRHAGVKLGKMPFIGGLDLVEL
ncbi:MAG: DUF1993 domain-containing protein [Sandaracinus sp.]|nr:DUF1993 domain-containing protein [Sandaracinus sp.]MCB9620119.1 DUF1993 domain-containing protein [Sandaracinus sp.]MCB9631679.1 DUF1993 domain-containing protein [Sandaracinus sp.]